MLLGRAQQGQAARDRRHSRRGSHQHYLGARVGCGFFAICSGNAAFFERAAAVHTKAFAR